MPKLFQYKFMPALFAADGIAFFLAFEMLCFFASGTFSIMTED